MQWKHSWLLFRVRGPISIIAIYTCLHHPMTECHLCFQNTDQEFKAYNCHSQVTLETLVYTQISKTGCSATALPLGPDLPCIVCCFPSILNSYFSKTAWSRGQVVRHCDENRHVNVHMGGNKGWVGCSLIWFRAGSNLDWQFPILKRRQKWCIMHEWPVLHQSYCLTLHCVPLLLP